MKKIDQGARKWLAKFASRNYWRVSPWIEFDDLLQDGLMCWCIVATRYQRANRRHLMALFQRTFSNHLHRLANKRTVCLELPVESLPDTVFCPDAEMASLINESPTPIRQCLREIVVHPELLARPMRRRSKYGARETTSHWLCAITGVNTDIDIATELRSMLKGVS